MDRQHRPYSRLSLNGYEHNSIWHKFKFKEVIQRRIVLTVNALHNKIKCGTKRRKNKKSKNTDAFKPNLLLFK